ncbi:OLC1v1026323C1 [Oldenlandia corymbosa var. corymbosa]|uniref:OLC1v1026323C1 n=1 Tax=Oldenlandia corymbosa var. corymbosa TaxID=529605 RepID=A0AAV1C6R1_OLDCO|nr:OLC1v1026323C1 [Oldenlandia corymbosa var. corymbosa]
MNSFVPLLRKCTNLKSILDGKAVHARVIISGSLPDVFTSNHLLVMYFKLNQVDDALKVFDTMPKRNSITWTTLVSSLSHMGHSGKALDCFRAMVLEGFSPNNYSYVGAISASTDIGAVRVGKELHGRIYRAEESLNSFVINSLVSFYGKCALLRSARIVFEAMLEPDLVSLASLISCYFQCGEDEEGLSLFLKYLRTGLKVNEFTFASVLGACARLESLALGMGVHCLAAKSGLIVDQFVVTGLVNLYAKCGLLDVAWQAFLEADEPHLSAWTALMGGCLQQGKKREAFELFYKLLYLGVKPSKETYATVFGAIADEMDIQVGEQLYCTILKSGFDSSTLICNTILAFYMKRGCHDESLRIFQQIEEHDVVTWNTMITGSVQSGHFEEAIGFLRDLLAEGLNPDDGLSHYNSMIRDYNISPSADHLACMVTLFARNGRAKEAFEFLQSFPGEPDRVVWRCLLSGCKTSEDVDLGRVAAEKILRIDPDDTSAHIMLSNVYADLRMWDELASIRKLMKEKELKKDTGISWTELQNKIVSFPASHNMDLEQNGVHEVLNGLTAHLFDEKNVPEIM